MLVVEGFSVHLLHAYSKYNKGFGDHDIIVTWGTLGNEELMCNYHWLIVKSLSSSEREESAKQL